MLQFWKINYKSIGNLKTILFYSNLYISISCQKDTINFFFVSGNIKVESSCLLKSKVNRLNSFDPVKNFKLLLISHPIKETIICTFISCSLPYFLCCKTFSGKLKGLDIEIQQIFYEIIDTVSRSIFCNILCLNLM